MQKNGRLGTQNRYKFGSAIHSHYYWNQNMKSSIYIWLLIILVMGSTLPLLATHNRAGEITYEQIDDLTIRATITTYTRTSSFAADRDSLDISWGDGTIQTIKRSNGLGEALPNDIKANRYTAEHTYPTRGTYKLSVTDPNRIAGILNIDFPNSVNIQFYLETTFTLLDPRFQGFNSSARLLQPPIDFACVGQIFTHNPNAFDPDGDSLGYELIVPFQAEGLPVPNYDLPDKIRPGPDNNISLLPNGDFVWDSPKIQGEFNIVYLIKEYRGGVLINSIIRDMQILVRSCPDFNKTPVIEAPESICVIAGEEIIIDIIATDPNPLEVLSISALGGPFEIVYPAILDIATPDTNSMATARIIWQTTCDHVSDQPYQFVVKVTDEITREATALAALKTITIKVTAPPPLNPEAVLADGRVRITWDAPYLCDEAEGFQGFSVWRRIGPKSVPIDTCLGGLDGQDYEEIIFRAEEIEDGRYVAYDAELESDVILCYRLLGEYAKTTPRGQPFNRSESIRSEEICIRTNPYAPLITKASVINTDAANGSVVVHWLLPDPDIIDPEEFAPPYGITIRGSSDFSGAGLQVLPGGSSSSNLIEDLMDTSYIHDNINTLISPHAYEVTFESGSGARREPSQIASTILVSAVGADRVNRLTWEENVPWLNYEYEIQRRNGNGDLDFIATTDQRSYHDLEALNGVEDCYVIKAYGRYGLSEVNEPLINYSQEVCVTPRDSIAPCPPLVTVQTLCEQSSISPGQALINTVTWTYGSETCPTARDISAFNLYFSSTDTDNPQLIAEIDLSSNLFDHLLSDNIAGCYSVAAVDSSGNEGQQSEEFCVDNCPSYELPNAFTPNKDNANDLFVPRINRFIASIDLEVYNRWGQVVHTSTDPAINWDGTNISGKELAEGTYYYVCKVFENRVAGIIERDGVLQGTIQIIR